MILKNLWLLFPAVFFFSSYTDFLNGPFRQIKCFSVTSHLWLSPERLVLLFINDNKGERTVTIGV